MTYSWPGNVRELENAVERAVILSRNGVLVVTLEHRKAAPESKIDDELRSRERSAIESVLALTGGRVSGERGAAVKLGLPASTLEFRIKRLGINKFQYRETRN